MAAKKKPKGKASKKPGAPNKAPPKQPKRGGTSTPPQ